MGGLEAPGSAGPAVRRERLIVGRVLTPGLPGISVRYEESAMTRRALYRPPRSPRDPKRPREKTPECLNLSHSVPSGPVGELRGAGSSALEGREEGAGRVPRDVPRSFSG